MPLQKHELNHKEWCGEMAKEDNLKPIQSAEEARKKGRNGGIKSGEVRRRKRDAKSAARLLLDLPATDSLKSNLKALGIDEGDYTNMVAMMARAFAKAMSGDISAMNFLISMSGTSPQFKMEEQRHKKYMKGSEVKSSIIDEWIASIPDVEGENEQK